MKSSISILFFTFCFSLSIIYAQDKNKGIFTEPKPGYYDEILKTLMNFKTHPKKKQYFKLDFTGMDIPKSKEEFKSFWHNDPISQGQTGTCWSFSTTSFFESEVYRLTGKEVSLSPIYTAYWEYVEKAKEFIRTRGKSLLKKAPKQTLFQESIVNMELFLQMFVPAYFPVNFLTITAN